MKLSKVFAVVAGVGALAFVATREPVKKRRQQAWSAVSGSSGRWQR